MTAIEHDLKLIVEVVSLVILDFEASQQVQVVYHILSVRT